MPKNIVVASLVLLLALTPLRAVANPGNAAAKSSRVLPTITVDDLAESVLKEFAPDETPKPREYPIGTYAVGKDVPAGEYVFETTGGYGGYPGYLCVTKDSTGDFASIIYNAYFFTWTIGTLQKGQYVQIDSGKFYAMGEALPFEPKDGYYPEGMYKVGVHIQAGAYELEAAPGVPAYFCISSDSSHAFDSIVSNDMFSGSRHIEVQEGQYLTVNRARIKVN